MITKGDHISKIKIKRRALRPMVTIVMTDKEVLQEQIKASESQLAGLNKLLSDPPKFWNNATVEGFGKRKNELREYIAELRLKLKNQS